VAGAGVAAGIDRGAGVSAADDEGVAGEGDTGGA